MLGPLLLLVAVVSFTFVPGSPVFAQDSRVATIAAAQAEKAKTLAPREPGAAERALIWVQEELILAPSGFYPLFGSVHSGGGLAFGAGYRRYYGDNTHWDLKTLYSLKNYKLVELSTDSWGHASGRFDAHARVGWRDATQVPFHGLGIDSPTDRTNFGMAQTYAGADIAVRPSRWSIARLAASYEDFAIGEGAGRHPSIEQVFTPVTTPGLGDEPVYLHSMVSAGIDWRPAPGYARRGGLYEVRYHNYADRNDTYSFDRLDGELVQHLPLLRENWVISLRGLAQTTLRDDDTVPFFLLPSLGSGDTLRGYSAWRFRDRHSLLMTGEFRWIPNRNAMDVALFYDAGKVTSQRRDLDLDNLKSNVGVGVRFHSPMATPLRIELARGSEGLRLVFAGSAAF
jgi:hypothetical protein